jgi:hypothetical protein
MCNPPNVHRKLHVILNGQKMSDMLHTTLPTNPTSFTRVIVQADSEAYYRVNVDAKKLVQADSEAYYRVNVDAKKRRMITWLSVPQQV